MYYFAEVHVEIIENQSFINFLINAHILIIGWSTFQFIV